ncbi:hypothetical protein BaRGS_00029135 [Batillaria attramentaria]|uniref:Uncharacterized protein n=1 Tax=Batillaria attramentaria TaxID=370345 RepID=A0ABD0JX06_9CAEN
MSETKVASQEGRGGAGKDKRSPTACCTRNYGACGCTAQVAGWQSRPGLRNGKRAGRAEATLGAGPPVQRCVPRARVLGSEQPRC